MDKRTQSRTQVSVIITSRQRALLEEWRWEARKTVSDIVRDAIQEYVDRHRVESILTERGRLQQTR